MAVEHDDKCERSPERGTCGCVFRSLGTSLRHVEQQAEDTPEEQQQLINADVLLSSGDLDEWVDILDAVVEPELGGALVILGPEKLAAIYAPGMWMKVEYR